MSKRMTSKAVLGGVAAVAALMGACATEPAREGDLERGTLEMALVSQGSLGDYYLLAGTFVLNDLENTTVTTYDTSDSLTLTPRVGTYDLELCATGTANPRCTGFASWDLFEVTCTDLFNNPAPFELCTLGDPNFVAQLVSATGATLSTPNPQPVGIGLNQTTYANFQFVVPGKGTVNFARGTLNIDFNVTEGYADGSACTTAVECQSKVCADSDNDGQLTCQTASCTDGVQNGGEFGPDCGGPCATLCPGMCDAATPCPPGELCDPNTNQCTPGYGLPCLDNSQCPAGYLCDAFQMVCLPYGCQPDGSCPAGMFCDPATFLCVSSGTGSVCTSDADCAAGEACLPGSGTCVPASETCSNDSQCPAGWLCDVYDRLCYSVGTPACTTDADCAVGEVCDVAMGECLANGGLTCSVDADCPMTQVCDLPTGMCAGGGTGWTCNADADCAAGYLCDPLLGACASGSACTSNADCGALVCDVTTGACVPCANDGDCSAPLSCRNGLCELLISP